MTSDKVLGIDLGTTNSAFAILEGGEPEIIPNSEGDRIIPSVVKFEEEGGHTVGKSAKNQAIQNAERTVASIKRHIGNENYTFEVDDESYKPEEISAIILKRIKQDAEEYIGDEIERAVITVPAYFNDKQRQATKDAGEIAGFNVERIINEPTAAAMAYGLNEDSDKTVLVYDLGGGTFDVSVLDIGGGLYEVIATSGINDLGGDDWDAVILDYLVESFKEENGIDLSEDPASLQRLHEEAEKAKKRLSNTKKVEISIPFIAATDDGPVHLEEELTRSKFEELTSDLIDRTAEPTIQALEESGYSSDEINDVILVGGATRMPQVKKKLENIPNFEASRSVNPDEAVALGAAIQGGILSGELEDVVLLDVAPLSLGIETKGGLFEPLIEQNTTIPTKSSKVFTTARDNQTSVKIGVYQGEREIAEENQLLAVFDLHGIKPAPAGAPEIKVTFKIDENGIVHVSAEDLATESRKEVKIEGGYGLSDEEIEKMKKDAEKHSEEDELRKKRVEIQNHAEETIRKAEGVLEDDVGEEIITEIKSNKKNLEETLEKDDSSLSEIKEKNQELEESIKEAGREIYSSNTAIESE